MPNLKLFDDEAKCNDDSNVQYTDPKTGKKLDLDQFEDDGFLIDDLGEMKPRRSKRVKKESKGPEKVNLSTPKRKPSSQTSSSSTPKKPKGSEKINLSTPKRKSSSKSSTSPTSKKLSKEVKSNEERPKKTKKTNTQHDLKYGQVNLLIDQDFHYFSQDFDNICLFQNELIFIIPKKEVNLKFEDLSEGQVLTIPEVLSKSISKNIFTCQVPLDVQITISKTKEKVKEPHTEFEGIVEHIYTNKNESKVLYLKTKDKIYQIKDDHLIMAEMNYVKLYNLKLYKNGANTYYRTYKDSFVKIVSEFNLRKIRYLANWRSGQADTCQYIQGYIINCAYFNNRNTFTDNQGNKTSLLWGKIGINIHNEANTTHIGCAHEGFKYFGLKLAAHQQNWQQAKQALDDFISQNYRVKQKVRVLVKIYMSNGKKAFKAVHITNIDKFD